MKGLTPIKLGEVGFTDRPIPECGPLDAICRPTVLAPCTSDIHTTFEGAFGDVGKLALGHEAIGEVVKVGELVKTIKVGDKVIVPCTTPDWGTPTSQEGYPMHCCSMLSGVKFSTVKEGVFAEFFHVNDADANLYPFPEGLTDEQAIMITDMVTTGFHGAELANVKLGDSVCVIGIGPVGLMSVAGAKLMGAAQLIAVGSRKRCCDLAREYGATDIVNYRDGPIEDQVMKLTGGKGVDCVIVAGGDGKTFTTAVKICKTGGSIGNVNFLAGAAFEVPIPAWGFGMGHKKINGGLTPGGRVRMERLANLVLAGRFDPAKLVTHRFEGFEKIKDALMLMAEKPPDVIKPVVFIKYDK